MDFYIDFWQDVGGSIFFTKTSGHSGCVEHRPLLKTFSPLICIQVVTLFSSFIANLASLRK
jgi:hypothetical protein